MQYMRSIEDFVVYVYRYSIENIFTYDKRLCINRADSVKGIIKCYCQYRSLLFWSLLYGIEHIYRQGR